MQICVRQGAQQVAEEVVERLCVAASTAIQRRGAFHCVLAGGATPEQAYRLLAQRPMDWLRWHLYLGDERVLPAGDPQRNSTMVEQVWLQRLAGPQPHWYPIATEQGMQSAVNGYIHTLAAVELFDLVLLGMGEDGHTASLFPGVELSTNSTVQRVENAPKPPAARVSLTLPRLCATRELLVVVTGVGKRAAMQQWIAGEALPIARLTQQAAKGAHVELVIDQATVAGLNITALPSVVRDSVGGVL